jgi:hypothetical protein
LNHSLYDLKQASSAWYSRFASYLVSLGFVEAKSDTSMFIHRYGDNTIYLLLYVDDIVLTTSSAALLQCTIVALYREFVMKDLGPLHNFLEITAERRAGGLRVSSSTSASTRPGHSVLRFGSVRFLGSCRNSVLQKLEPK